MTIPQDTHKGELRNLAAKIQDAVENYAQGKTKNSSEIVKLCQDLQHRSESPEVFAERLRYQVRLFSFHDLLVHGSLITSDANFLRANINITSADLTTSRWISAPL